MANHRDAEPTQLDLPFDTTTNSESDPKLTSLYTNFTPSDFDTADDEPSEVNFNDPRHSTSDPIRSQLQLSDIHPQRPIPSNVPTRDTPNPTYQPRRRLTNIQKDQVARLMVAGVPRAQIAAAYGVAPATIAEWEKEEGGEWEHRRGREATALNRQMVDLIYGMHARLPDSMLHLDADGFASSDAKVRLETAKYVIGYCERYQAAQMKVSTTQVAQVNNQINVDTTGIVEATRQISDVLLELRGSRLGGLSRVKQGPDGLPGPAAMSELAQVAQAEAASTDANADLATAHANEVGAPT